MVDDALLDLNGLELPRLWAELARSGHVRRLLELARDEDLGPGVDATALVASSGSGDLEARLVAREAGVIAGLAAGADLAAVFGSGVRIEGLVADGTPVDAATPVAVVRGPAAAVVTLERTLLNLVGRLSGVATRTAAFVERVSGTGAVVLDTRKTTPGLRALEKYAVRCGGGLCHRLGLWDAVLIKDNHVAGLDLDGFAERVGRAVSLASDQRDAGKLRFVEVECDSPEQFGRVLEVDAGAGLVDFVLLDNFDLDGLRAAVRVRDETGSPIRLEASGGVTPQTIRAIAETGVDRISVGALTHHAVSLDMGLDA